MHPQVRHARFNLIVCAITAVLTATAYFTLLATLGPLRARAAYGFFGILGLLGFGPSFYRQNQAVPGVIMDERDKQIGDHSRLVALRAASLYWALLCMGPWAWVAIRSGLGAVEKPFLAVAWLPWILMTSNIVYFMAWSIAVLRSYRHEKDSGID